MKSYFDSEDGSIYICCIPDGPGVGLLEMPGLSGLSLIVSASSLVSPSELPASCELKDLLQSWHRCSGE